MKIGSILENQTLEKRIAVTPEIVKKYFSLGFEIFLSKDYGSHLGINDKEYEVEGANIFSAEDVISNSNAILQMNILKDENLKVGDNRIVAQKEAIIKLAAHYIMKEKNKKGLPINDVSRFHLGNGAKLLQENDSTNNFEYNLES